MRNILIAFALYAFVLVAGVLLLENSERGIHLSSIAQLLQLPLIGTPIFSYGLHCGAFINVFTSLHLHPLAVNPNPTTVASAC